MGEITNVVCDDDDCYKTLHDTSADTAHEESYLDTGGMDAFVTAFKRMHWDEAWPRGEGQDPSPEWMKTDVWRTWCPDCAQRMNLSLYRRKGWTVQVPEGFTEGEPCDSCSYDVQHPWGVLDNGEKPWTGSGATFKTNPDFKQWTCKAEGCKDGWVKPQVAREVKR